MNITKQEEISSGIKVWRRGERILLFLPYSPQLIEKAKTIKGYRWHPEEKYWRFPNTDGSLEKILKAFEGEKIHIDSALKSATSRAKGIPSPLAGKGLGEGYNFEDLRNLGGMELI